MRRRLRRSMLGVDLVNFPKFPRVDDGVTYPKAGLDIRQRDRRRLRAPSSPTTAGRTAPTCASPTSRATQLVRRCSCRGASEYYSSASTAWAAEVAQRYGDDAMAEIEWAAWNDQVVPELERMRDEFLPAGTAYVDRTSSAPSCGADTRVVYTGLFTPRAELRRARQGAARHAGSSAATSSCCSASRRGPRRSSCATGSTRCSTSSCSSGATSVLPGVKKLKARVPRHHRQHGRGLDEGPPDRRDVVAGQGVRPVFEMPEPDVGIMTFNRCVAADQWEAMGRPDILEKNCHSTCPKSMIVTTQDVQPEHEGRHPGDPPAGRRGDVCCKWRFSMRDEDDPEYVPVELSTKRLASAD